MTPRQLIRRVPRQLVDRVPKRFLPKFLHEEENMRVSYDEKRFEHLREGPLKMAKFALWWTRKTFFVKQKTDNPAFFVTMDEDEIVDLLGREYFEPGWELSYSFQDENLNLRRVEYAPDHQIIEVHAPPDPDVIYEWWQVHIRGYPHEAGEQYGPSPDERFEADTFELAAHFELEPTEYPQSHVDHIGLEIRRGAMAVRDILEAHDVEYEYRYLDGRPADVEVDPFLEDHGDVAGPGGADGSGATAAPT